MRLIRVLITSIALSNGLCAAAGDYVVVWTHEPNTDTAIRSSHSKRYWPKAGNSEDSSECDGLYILWSTLQPRPKLGWAAYQDDLPLGTSEEQLLTSALYSVWDSFHKHCEQAKWFKESSGMNHISWYTARGTVPYSGRLQLRVQNLKNDSAAPVMNKPFLEETLFKDHDTLIPDFRDWFNQNASTMTLDEQNRCVGLFLYAYSEPQNEIQAIRKTSFWRTHEEINTSINYGYFGSAMGMAILVLSRPLSLWARNRVAQNWSDYLPRINLWSSLGSTLVGLGVVHSWFNYNLLQSWDEQAHETGTEAWRIQAYKSRAALFQHRCVQPLKETKHGSL